MILMIGETFFLTKCVSRAYSRSKRVNQHAALSARVRTSTLLFEKKIVPFLSSPTRRFRPLAFYSCASLGCARLSTPRWTRSPLARVVRRISAHHHHRQQAHLARWRVFPSSLISFNPHICCPSPLNHLVCVALERARQNQNSVHENRNQETSRWRSPEREQESAFGHFMLL